ncbi:hypothetical protein JOB18_017393 [Solea senegalensis]|nr:granulocyte-macrophage colony-stimulating factor receptor subunit alpha-like [Solea senegalensis]KAG7524826.1 interleukin-5 receptor subunit alpha-like [Solea senegalensis]KAG7524827.1 hypothetical protein JOB18_017393 [Solea senegalensis]
MLCLVNLICWTIFLVLGASHGVTEENNQDVCQEEQYIDELSVKSSTGQEVLLEMKDINETFICLLYPTYLLNCSWSFLTEEEDTQLSVTISICDGNTPVQSPSYSSVERVGSRTLTQQQLNNLQVVLQFNMSWPDKWKVYSYKYDSQMLEFLPPPTNVSATVTNGSLVVKWALPHDQSHPMCFEYQLDLGDQEAPRHLGAQLSYTELSADPTHTYRVRIRMRRNSGCIGSAQWGEWSPTVTVEQPCRLNILLMVTLSFGIPMILLAVLLLMRQQRLSTLLFPPIPRPPSKYMHFLEKSDTFSFPYPALPSKTEEEITKVEVAEENPETFKSMNMTRTHSNL